MLKNIKILLLLTSAGLLSLNFISYNIVEDNNKVEIHEKFDSSLIRLNSLDKLEAYVDSLALAKNIAPGSLEYAIEAKNAVSNRFYHKYSTQDLNENWIASLIQKITGLYLSSKITADDILTKPYGYCGQQNTVLMELLKRKKQDYRVVYFPHHFAIQSKIKEQWYYFDADLEPDIRPDQRASEKWLTNTDSLTLAYMRGKQWAYFNFGNPVTIKFGKVNEVQGHNAQIFQTITRQLSHIAFLFPLVLYFYLNKRKKISATRHSE